MAAQQLAAYAAASAFGASTPALPTRAADAAASATEAAEAAAHQRHGQGRRPSTGHHAILLVREAPRLGAVVSGAGATLRRRLEARQLVDRPPLGRIVFATDHFLLDGATESDQERFSIIYTLRSPIVQTAARSGRVHRTYSYNGRLLINAQEGSQFTAWQLAWDRWLRASRQVMANDRRALETPYVVELIYRDQKRRGYLLSCQRTADAQLPGEARFSFTMFVVHEALLTPPPASRSAFEQVVSQAEPSTPQATVSVVRPGAAEFRA